MLFGNNNTQKEEEKKETSSIFSFGSLSTQSLSTKTPGSKRTTVTARTYQRSNTNSSLSLRNMYKKNPNNAEDQQKQSNKGIMLMIWFLLILITIEKLATILPSLTTTTNDSLLVQPLLTKTTPEEQEWLLAGQSISQKNLQEQNNNKRDNNNNNKNQQDSQRHYKFDLPPPLRVNKKKDVLTFRSIEDESSMELGPGEGGPSSNAPEVYSCFGQGQGHDFCYFCFGLNKMNVPNDTTAFNLRIIQKDQNNNQTTFPQEQSLFSFPRGFDSEELISGEPEMTLEDVRQIFRKAYYPNGTFTNTTLTLTIMVEEYTPDGLPTFDDENHNIAMCPNYESPSASPSIQATGFPSGSPSAPPSFHYNATNHHTGGTLPPVAFLSNGANRYNNTNPVDGPWEECLGWEGEDCRDYIKAIVPDAPKFHYFAVQWKNNSPQPDIPNHPQNHSDGTYDDVHPDDWEDVYQTDQGHWGVLGMSNIDGEEYLPPNFGPNGNRVFVVVNKDNIVVNTPGRG